MKMGRLPWPRLDRMVRGKSHRGHWVSPISPSRSNRWWAKNWNCHLGSSKKGTLKDSCYNGSLSSKSLFASHMLLDHTRSQSSRMVGHHLNPGPPPSFQPGKEDTQQKNSRMLWLLRCPQKVWVGLRMGATFRTSLGVSSSLGSMPGAN